ncbi:hypothetical protein HY500_01340 [Candidatus Woesearchaeota archaeon]|nr:hypothetical protein [Candidatus Woesearchaeota archaeon]
MDFSNTFIYYLESGYIFYALFILYLLWSVYYILTLRRNSFYEKPLGQDGAPVAKAGSDQVVTTGILIDLDGSESIGENLSYMWTQVEGEIVDLVDVGTKNPKFTPDKPGVYRFSLKVKDDKGRESLSDDVSILVSASENLNHELKELLLVMDELFGKLPKKEVKKFVKTEHYQTYKKALHEYGVR